MSTTIDSKVVEMRFDNRDFEKNVSTSLSSLDKLKAKLNLKGASSGLSQINSAIEKTNLSKIAAGVDALEKRFSTLGIIGKRVLENLTDSMMSFVRKTTSFFTGGIIQGGITRAMNLENAHFQLQGLLKDELKVSAVMKNVNDAVDGTAYSLDSAAKVASQLAASGYEAGEEMFTSLRAVAGVAAMTNSSYDDIGSIFTTVAGQGKLMTYQLQQLSFRGMNAAATLAEYLDVTEAEVRTMVTEGKIDFATFSAAMDDAFGEHAKKANETFTGAMSNVKASLARIGAEFISPLIEQKGALVQFLNALREKINEFKESIVPLANIFTDTVEKIAEKATDFLKKISVTEAIKNFTENVKLSDKTAEKLKRTLEGLHSAFDLVKKAIAIVAKAIGSLFGSGAVDGALNVIFSITAAIGDMITAFNNSINVDDFSSVFKGISDVISGALHGVAGFGDSLSTVGKYVAGVVGEIWSAFKSAFGWIADNVSLSDVFTGLAGGSIYAAGRTLVELLTSLKGLSSKMNKEGILGLIFGSGDKQDPIKKVGYVLESLNEALIAFTSGIKVSSLLAISGAIAVLTISLKTLSGLKIGKITKSLTAIGILFGVMNLSFKKIKNILSDFTGKGIVKVGITLMMMAKSINILADAVNKLAGLSLKELGTGLAGISGSMVVLATGLRAINGVKIKVTTIIAIGVLANALKKVAETLAELGNLSWGEIKKSLSAIGGALTEFLITLAILKKIGGIKTLTGSISLLVTAHTLDEVANALLEVGKLSWSEIKKGLSGIGGALTELAVISGTFGKLAGFSGLVGSVNLRIGVKSLGDIAQAFQKFTDTNWKTVKMGLVGMGGVLTEVAVISGLLGKLAGFSGILGAATLLIAVRSLDDIANALSTIGQMSWSGIQNGLIGMGVALTEMTIVIKSLGELEGFSGLIGGAALLIAAKSLGDIADTLSVIGQLSWSEIGRGLAGMGGALLEIGAISGALGYLTGIAGMMGAGAIFIAAKGLGDIANALKIFGEMSWSEIGRGLTAMGAALSEVAIGGLLSSFSGLGAKSISKIAEPLGTLADSVKKWTNVSVPDNLGDSLALLAKGVRSFTLSGLGAKAISTVAKPLGIMADAIKTWSQVSVPANLKEQLTSLSGGIKSFSFAFMGGWSLSTIAGPLGKLADSVDKWNSITIPADLGVQLGRLAEGINAFSFSFLAGWSLEAVTGPLGELADSVKKWKDISVPENLSDQMKTLAESIKVFKGIKGLKKSGDFFTTISASVKTLASANLSTVSSGLDELSDSFVTLGESSASISGVGDKIAANLTKPLGNLKSKLKNGGATLVKSLAKGISSSGAAETAASNLASSVTSSLNSSKNSASSAGANIATALANGIKTKKSTIGKALTTSVSSGLTLVRGYRKKFYNAGSYLAEGFKNGLSSHNTEIKKAAEDMAEAAEKATRAILKINSPSKVFIAIGAGIPEGFIKGISSLNKGVTAATDTMGNAAIDGTKKAIANLAGVINSDIETQPTIQPIVDLSNVREGVNALGGMFGSIPVGLSANLNAVSGTMGKRNQNGTADDVVTAINGLRNELGKVGNTSYNINGITYDDGSTVSSAVESIVRAARIGRRA